MINDVTRTHGWVFRIKKIYIFKDRHLCNRLQTNCTILQGMFKEQDLFRRFVK